MNREINLNILFADEKITVDQTINNQRALLGYINYRDNSLAEYAEIFSSLPKIPIGKIILGEYRVIGHPIGGACSYSVICEREGVKYLFKAPLTKKEHLNNEQKFISAVYTINNSYTCKNVSSIIFKYNNIEIHGYAMEYLDGYMHYDAFINSITHNAEQDEAKSFIRLKLIEMITNIRQNVSGFKHNDINPNNILIKRVSDSLDIKIIDFGQSLINSISDDIPEINNLCR